MLYFFLNKRYWHFNPDFGAIMWGFSKVFAKQAPKVLGGFAGATVGFDQVYGSVTQFQPSSEYGKVLRGEQSMEQFNSALIDSYRKHFGKAN